jgi:hypothetical protein
MKARFPGEYIHMVLLGFSTLKDGEVTMFLSVDNFSRYSFSHTAKSPITFGNLTDHVNTMIDELTKRHPAVVPTFIMGYGEEMEVELAFYYKGRANFLFNRARANAIARPVAKDLLKHLNQMPGK